MQSKLKLLILGICCLFSSGLWAQQRPQFTQYMVHNMLINPAMAGAYPYTDIRVGYRNQWSGLENANDPRTFFISANFTPIGKPRPLPTIGTGYYHEKRYRYNKRGHVREFWGNLQHGLGGLIALDQTSPINRLHVYLNYGVHAPLNDLLKISLGIQAGIVQYRLDQNDLRPNNPDPIIGSGNVNELVPDLGLGLMVYQANKFYGGFSIAQLLQNNLDFGDSDGQDLELHYYLTGGYRWDFSQTAPLSLYPSVLLKWQGASPVSLDLNLRLAYNFKIKGNNRYLWAGISYRQEDAVAGLVGLSILNNLELNYSYDFTTSRVSNFSQGTHEISLGLRLPRRVRDNGSFKNYYHNLF